MKVDLEKIEMGVSSLTGEVYIGTLNPSRQSWRNKKLFTNQFIDTLLSKYTMIHTVEATKTVHTITCGSHEWEITIKKTK